MTHAFGKASAGTPVLSGDFPLGAWPKPHFVDVLKSEIRISKQFKTRISKVQNVFWSLAF
jgi:hypothetical protein